MHDEQDGVIDGRRRSLMRAGLALTALAPTTVRAAARPSRKHTLLVLNPGHFHAGLTLRAAHPRLNENVYVYAQDGPDVDAFLRMVNSFNTRERDPTRWSVHVYRGPHYLARLREERRGDVVVVAGRNDEKMASIHALHGDGFSVLGDKPWLIGADRLPLLARTATPAPLAMDIMTERHEIMNRLQRALAGMPDVFGEFRRDDDAPAVEMRGIHHLYKIVNGRPLVRPGWFFDPAIQGEGITDVTTHLVDLSQWMVGGEKPVEFDRDVELVAARQWSTDVPREIFERITGLRAFPHALGRAVEGDTLHHLCNAQIDYRLRGVPVRIVSLWNLAIPEGGGDSHFSVLRGTRADLVVDQGPQSGHLTRLTIHPVQPGPDYPRAIADAVSALQAEFPGAAVEPVADVYRVSVPAALRTSHEAHFAAVLDEFLGYVDRQAWPENLGPDLVAKYTLLVRARALSHRSNV